MSKAALLFKRFGVRVGGILAVAILLASPAFAEIKKTETGLYRDVFDQNLYYEGLQYFHLDRLYNSLFSREVRSANINVFDEVPDSSFFTNRHGRIRMSASELEQGYKENEGPDFSQGLTITKGKFEGLHPGFFVKDSKGDAYLLKFDAADNLELATGAEIITSRFMHAIGYNVPQYTIAHFTMDGLKIDPNATTYDDTGFKKKLTMERLQEYLIFVPQDEQGRYRASASKILEGQNKGYMPLKGMHPGDTADTIDHKDRREIRALRVVASWLNIYDIRESNTLDYLVDENGRKVLKHFLIDFNDSLGSAADGPKPPQSGHEHLYDFGEAFKSFLTLGWWKKPWQKRWDEAGREAHSSPAIGYFDNRYFDPGRFKTQLPAYAFKDLTRADGFWAAKIIMAFSDEDIRALVKAGQLTTSEDEEYLAKTLIGRRDQIGRYWFQAANPLDDFELQGGELRFKDLAVEHDFQSQETTTYEVHIFEVTRDGKGKRLKTLKTKENRVDLGQWLSRQPSLDLLIRTSRSSSTAKSPHVLLRLEDGHVTKVAHED